VGKDQIRHCGLLGPRRRCGPGCKYEQGCEKKPFGSAGWDRAPPTPLFMGLNCVKYRKQAG
jgi:hypothetical protein